MNYYINGWRENREYFMNLGKFTMYELNSLLNGDTVTKNGNEFRIEFKEEN